MLPAYADREEDARVGRIDRALVPRRAGRVASHAGVARQPIDAGRVAALPQVGEEAAVHVVDFEVRSAVLHAHAEVDRQVRRHPPVVLEVEVVLPVPHVAIDAAGQLGVGREHAEQHVGVAVAGAERIVRVVTEVEVAHVVGRTRLGLAVVLERQSGLEVVPSARVREVVVEIEPAAQVEAGNRLVGSLDIAVGDAEISQVGAIAAGRAETRRVRPFVHLLANPLTSGGSE